MRHGETDANANGIVQGWLDTDLNARGHAQADVAAEMFNEDIDAIYSSDLKRALQTAVKFRNKYSGIPFFEDARLRERNFGDAAGDCRDNYDWERFWSSSDGVSIPNAETLDEYNQRVWSFIIDIKSAGFKKVLIVTHSGTINRWRDLTTDNYAPVAHHNATVVRLSI